MKEQETFTCLKMWRGMKVIGRERGVSNSWRTLKVKTVWSGSWSGQEASLRIKEGCDMNDFASRMLDRGEGADMW